MPNFFQLIRKSEPEKGPVELNVIDAEISNHLSVKVEPTRWCHYWYNTIGLALACGQSLETLLNEAKQHEPDYPGDQYWLLRTKILEYLSNNYIVNCWVERK